MNGPPPETTVVATCADCAWRREGESARTDAEIHCLLAGHAVHVETTQRMRAKPQ